MDIYNVGLDALQDWITATYRFALLKDATPFDPDHLTVADAIGVDEISVSGYSRPTAGTKVRTVDGSNDLIAYTCAAPSFGTLAAGETVTGIMVYRFVTNDADSIPIGLQTLPTFTASDFYSPSAFIPTLAGGVIANVRQAP